MISLGDFEVLFCLGISLLILALVVLPLAALGLWVARALRLQPKPRFGAILPTGEGSTGWYYTTGNTKIGPVGFEVLAAALASGELTPSDFVRTDRMDSWRRAEWVVQPSDLGPRASDSRLTRALLPIGRSDWAIASGYLALTSWIPLVGLAAVATGVLGILEIRRRDDLHGMGRAVFGIVMGGLCTGLWVYFLASL